MQYNSLKQMPSGGLASFLESNMDEIGDNVLAFGAPQGINSMTDIGNRMANMGRNGDNQLVHMKTGEIAVSPDLLEENPRLANELTQAFDRSNVDMNRYTAGSGANSLNPMTGQPEFFLKKLVGGIKNLFKKIAPILVPLAINFFAPGLGTVASGALGAGIGTLVQGGSLKDAFKSAAFGGLAGGVSAAAGFGGPQDAAGFKERAFGRLGGMPDTPILRPGWFGTPAASPESVTTPAMNTSDLPPDSSSYLDQAVNKAKGFYNENLAPGRDVLTTDQLMAKPEFASLKAAGFSAKEALAKVAETYQPSMISKYGPLALAGTGLFAAAGGFETPEEDTSSPYGRTSREEFEGNPNKYSIYSGINFRGPLSGRRPDINRNPFVFQNYLGEQPTQYVAAGGEMSSSPTGFTSQPVLSALYGGSSGLQGPGPNGASQGTHPVFSQLGRGISNAVTERVPDFVEDVANQAENTFGSEAFSQQGMGHFGVPSQKADRSQTLGLSQMPNSVTPSRFPVGLTQAQMWGQLGPIGQMRGFMAEGGEMEFPRRDGYIGGPGTETSDDIPAMLSDGEFVMTSKAVRGLGNGSRKQGVRKMYDMMRAFEGGVVA